MLIIILLVFEGLVMYGQRISVTQKSDSCHNEVDRRSVCAQSVHDLLHVVHI